MKSSTLKRPINGGVNYENGNMVLLFEESSGLQHRLELPFDESGMMMEILERASTAAAEWADKHKGNEGTTQKVNVRPRDTESILVGADVVSGRPLLIVRLNGGTQFSFALDTKAFEQLQRMGGTAKSDHRHVATGYESVADDIEWLQSEWCFLYEPPSNAALRRGSAALRRLLVENGIQNAWHHYGFSKKPLVIGPDVKLIAAHKNHQLRDAVSLIAGGGTVNGVQAAFIASFRVQNPETGKGPDASEGFAVAITRIFRDAREPGPPNELTPLVNRSWPLDKYISAIGAIRRGVLFSRQNIISYFANHAGGVHLDRVKNTTKAEKNINTKKQYYDFLEELERVIIVDNMDGLYFEILSIGQTIGNSSDIQLLAKKIRGEGTEHLA